MRKNVAGQSVSFKMIATADGSNVNTGTPTVFITIDGGTQAAGAGTSTSKGNGEWSYAPTQAETNGNHVAFTMDLTNAVGQTVNVFPVAFNPSNSADLGLTALTGNVPQTADVAVRVPVALNVTALGNIGIDLANVENPTTVLNLSGTTVKAITDAVTAGTVNDKTGYSLTTANIQTIWDVLTTSLTTAGSVGELINTNLDVTVSSRMPTSHINATGGVVDTVTAITNDVGVTQTGADKVWASAARSLTDKLGFELSASGVQAVWDILTSSLTTVGSAGKLIVDNVDATVSSRMPISHINATAGKVDGVALTDTTTTVTDGAKSATALSNATWTDTKAGYIDTTISSRNSVAPDNVSISNIQTQIGVAGAGLTDLGGMSATMKSQVNAEVLDNLQTKLIAELAAVPGASSSLADKISWVFMLARNQLEQTSNTLTVRADDGTTAVATSSTTDDTTTATRGEFI